MKKKILSALITAALVVTGTSYAASKNNYGSTVVGGDIEGLDQALKKAEAESDAGNDGVVYGPESVRANRITAGQSVKKEMEKGLRAQKKIGDEALYHPLSDVTKKLPPLYNTEVDATAYEEAVKNKIPLSPIEITRFRQMLDAAEQAKNKPLKAPKAKVISMPVSLEPGSIPQTIKLANGFVTTLVFVDSTGASWPIAEASAGNGTDFYIKYSVDNNVMTIAPLRAYTFGNLSVTLKNSPVPVVFSLDTNSDEVFYRSEMMVQAMGPNAKPVVYGTNSPVVNDPDMIAFLDGVGVSGATKLKVAGGSIRDKAWMYNGDMYLRTKAQLLSPAWNAQQSSADGTNIYRMGYTPIAVVTKDGSKLKLKIKE